MRSRVADRGSKLLVRNEIRKYGLKVVTDFAAAYSSMTQGNAPGITMQIPNMAPCLSGLEPLANLSTDKMASNQLGSASVGGKSCVVNLLFISIAEPNISNKNITTANQAGGSTSSDYPGGLSIYFR